MRYFSLLLILALFTGCSIVGDSEDKRKEVAFTVEQNSYELNSNATAILSNDTDESISYNSCFSKLEQKKDGEWAFVGPAITCQAIATNLKPGEDAPHSVTLSDSLNLDLSSTYRITTGVGIGGENVTLTTGSFDIYAAVQQQ